MNWRYVLAVWVCLVSFAHASEEAVEGAAGSPSNARSVEKQTQALVGLLGDFYSFECGDRQITYEDLSGDNIPDAIVIFNVCGFGGGNSASSYVAIFEAIQAESVEIQLPPTAMNGFTVRPDGRLFLPNGQDLIPPEPSVTYKLIDYALTGLTGKTHRWQIHSYLGHKGVLSQELHLLFRTGEYSDEDPPCCPSKEGRVTYGFVDERLVIHEVAWPNTAVQGTLRDEAAQRP